MSPSARTLGRTRNLHRGDPEDREGVDLLVRLHAADLGREGGPGAAREDDARHHGAHLARHRDADQVGDPDVAAEAPEHDGPGIGERHARRGS